jgi:ABC-type branched-subunit amino acid transport system permease subunit
MTLRTAVALAVCALALLVLPWIIGNEFYVNMATQVLIYALFALSINMMLGYGGMVSLGHAGYLGIAGYACILAVTAGYDHLTAAIFAVAVSTAAAAFFGLLSLRAPGLGFIMITLALGQIVWGIAYRANDLTGGDNGIRYPARPMPFGFDLRDAPSFYYFTLAVFVVALFCIWRFSRSPFGASLMGARDQPRRMRMLGYNVWLIQWLTFVMAGFWASIAGSPLRLLQSVPQPACDLAATVSRDPADGDPRRRQHAHRPDRRRRHHHAGEERDLDLCRALEHAARPDLRGRDHVHALRVGPPGARSCGGDCESGARRQRRRAARLRCARMARRKDARDRAGDTRPEAGSLARDTASEPAP